MGLDEHGPGVRVQEGFEIERVLRGLERPATAWAPPLQLLQYSAMGAEQGEVPVRQHPFPVVGHLHEGGEVCAVKMQHGDGVAFCRRGRSGRMECLDLRVGGLGLGEGDTRVVLVVAHIRRRRGERGLPDQGAPALGVEGQQLEEERRPGTGQTDHDQWHPDFLLQHGRFRHGVAFEKQASCQHPENDVLRDRLNVGGQIDHVGEEGIETVLVGVVATPVAEPRGLLGVVGEALRSSDLRQNSLMCPPRVIPTDTCV